MAKQIGCRTCNSEDCTGCNVYTLATMLDNGKFDNLTDNNRTIVQSFDVVEMCVEDVGPMVVRVIGDVAKVVRCKDCKHYGNVGCPMYFEEIVEWDDDGYHEWDTIINDHATDDGYCNYGERMAP